jgi:hypothetical protein
VFLLELKAENKTPLFSFKILFFLKLIILFFPLFSEMLGGMPGG